jgi:hypothetical protein
MTGFFRSSVDLVRVSGSLLEIVRHPDSSVRWRVASSVEHIGQAPPGSERILATMLDDADDLVRGYAAEALDRLGRIDSELAARLGQIALDDPGMARGAAFTALCRTGNPEYWPYVEKAYRNTPWLRSTFLCSVPYSWVHQPEMIELLVAEGLREPGLESWAIPAAACCPSLVRETIEAYLRAPNVARNDDFVVTLACQMGMLDPAQSQSVPSRKVKPLVPRVLIEVERRLGFVLELAS